MISEATAISQTLFLVLQFISKLHFNCVSYNVTQCISFKYHK